LIIAIASGKGGTGKTLVSVNLAHAYGSNVCLLDCDVEEPNDHLFLKGILHKTEIVNIPVPRIDEFKCNNCGKCSNFCQYNAITSIGKEILFFPEMCHGCGGCSLVCIRKAITEEDKRIGVMEFSQAGNISLIQGRLDVGISLAPPLIRAVKKQIHNGMPVILDAPPGTSCPVVTTLGGADFVVLVTEPTPFGLHDLKLAVALTRELGIPFGIIINRMGIGDERVHIYCRQNGFPILLEIPDDRRIAEAYSNGELIVDALPEYRQLFGELLKRINKLAHNNASLQYA
jgi:MinD superfamily P-loop ATPase